MLQAPGTVSARLMIGSDLKQSVIQDEVSSESSLSPYPSCFTQWVGDNVDHNTGTIDGHGSFHGMGLIAFLRIQPHVQRCRGVQHSST